MMSKTWKIPMPEEIEDVLVWKPVVRVGRIIPFGYRQDPEDSDIILPIPEELELLEQAKKYLKQYSLRNVADWLSEESQRYISHVGLMKRIKLEQKRKKEVSTQRYYAQRYKEASEKAKKLEDQRIGGRRVEYYEDSIGTAEA
tara:strand:+ start:324 stop:752 length:429 start_codon:yes stop_codon:yes gene_type:complete